MFDIDKNTEDWFFAAGWCVAAGLGLLYALVQGAGINPWNFLRPCMLHAVTGLYCPGCGGTRAVHAFLEGDILRSIRYHPFVPYVGIICIWFMASQTVERLSKGKIRIAMHFREIYMWIALGIIFVNFLIKNLVLIIWHVDLLA